MASTGNKEKNGGIGLFWTLFVVGVYMVIGPALILLNKFILHNLNFQYPMFLSGLGVLVSGIVARLLVGCGYITLQRKDAVEGLLWYRRVLPVGLAHAGTLAFGNTVYLFLNVGFIQMLKSFTPVIIMLTAYVTRIETPTRSVVSSVLVISLGTAMTCSFTPQLSLLGLFIMFMAELTEAVRLVMTQFLLQNMKFGVVEGLYVLAPASAFWLFLASACYEFRDMSNKGAFLVVAANPLTFLAASTMGLGVNFLSYYVIQATSSLTMKVLGTVRNIFTIFAGAFLYGETVTVNEWLGYSVALAGFAAYNAAKAGYWDGNNNKTASSSHKSTAASSSSGGLSPSSSASPLLGKTSVDDADVEANTGAAAGRKAMSQGQGQIPGSPKAVRRDTSGGSSNSGLGLGSSSTADNSLGSGISGGGGAVYLSGKHHR